MKIGLLQAIADQVKTVEDLASSVFLYSPVLDLDSKTKPFAVVRSLTDMAAIVTFDQAKEIEYYIWVYVYPQPNEYLALSLPEQVRNALLGSALTITIDSANFYTMPLDITVNRLNGEENDLERYGSVLTCIYKIYD